MSSPRLIIGVDLGMTFTGVAYSYSQDGPPRILDEEWPGAEGEVRRKVPTLLVYSPSTRSSAPKDSRHSPVGSSSSSIPWTATTWGFFALDGEERYSPNKKTREFFKLFLDEAVLGGIKKDHPEDLDFSHKDVCGWYKDFLSELYQHIRQYFRSKKPDLWNGQVRFVFSVPTTWREAVVDRFKTIFRDAGFGKEPGHTADVSLSEAQAAAVATAAEKNHMFKPGQLILVCDCGGGTTDILLLQVESAQGDRLRLKSMDKVRGIITGSTQIDRDFRNLVADKLNKANEEEVNKGQGAIIPDVDATVHAMAAERAFERHKCNLGPKALETDVPFHIKIQNMPIDFSHEVLGIQDGKLRFRPSEMALLFDNRLELIFEALDEQFHHMMLIDGVRDRSVSYMVLSGGLGSSQYVKEKLEERYCRGNTNGGRPTQGMAILQAACPQTVVCQGLVIDEQSVIHKKKKVLQSWITRCSYGIVGIKEFDPNNHLEQDKMADDEIPKLTGKTYVQNQITWVVHKGQRLDVNSETIFKAKRRFQRDIKDSKAKWYSRMVVSDLDLDVRPTSTSQAGSQPFCVLESDLSSINPSEFNLQNVRWWLLEKGKTHRVAKYEIKLIVGAADVKFELWYKGKKRSEKKDIKVAWPKYAVFDEIHRPTSLFLGLRPVKRRSDLR